MPEKKCAACGKSVVPGMGMYRNGRLIHKRCEGISEAFWFAGRRK